MILTLLYESQFVASVLMIIFIVVAIILEIILAKILVKSWKELKKYEEENHDTL